VVSQQPRFDPEKTKWFNQQYLRKHSDEELAELFIPVLKEKNITVDKAFVTGACKLLKEKANFVSEFWELGSFLFIAPTAYDEKVIAKKWNENSNKNFTALLEELKTVLEWNVEHIQQAIAKTEEKNQAKTDLQLLRVLVSGLGGGPSMIDMMQLLGKEEVVERISKALETIGK